MELKDVILSTLEELEHSKSESTADTVGSFDTEEKLKESEDDNNSHLPSSHNEAIFLENIKERIHVLFEGFQSPNNVNIEAKVDLTLNFLEYLLSSIEARLKEIKK